MSLLPRQPREPALERTLPPALLLPLTRPFPVVRSALRWLGFVCPAYQQKATLMLFGSARVGEWTQAWLEKLRGLGLKASSLAVYTNGVLSMCHYALSLEPNDACPVEELVVRLPLCASKPPPLEGSPPH